MPGLLDEVPVDLLREALTGLAVAARGAGDCGEPLVVAVLLEAVDGVVAGVVVGEDLGEEEAEGDPGGVDTLSPEVAAEAAGAFDEASREEFEEREPALLPESIPLGSELVARGYLGRLSHGDLLGVETDGSGQTARLPAKRVALYTQLSRFHSVRLSWCHSCQIYFFLAKN
jgi:hypothetical protein